MEYLKLFSNSSYIEMPFEQLVERALISDGSDIVFLDLHGSTVEKIVSHPDLIFEPFIATRCGVVFKTGAELSNRQSVHPSELCTMPMAINSFRDVAHLVDDIFAEYPLENVRLSVANPRMLLNSVWMRPDLLAISDSFGFHLTKKYNNALVSGLDFVEIDSPAALCFVGFLKSKSTATKVRAEYIRRVLRQWLEDHAPGYLVAYPTNKLWAQAIAQVSHKSSSSAKTVASPQDRSEHPKAPTD